MKQTNNLTFPIVSTDKQEVNKSQGKSLHEGLKIK
jgi:hypothetical protein